MSKGRRRSSEHEAHGRAPVGGEVRPAEAEGVAAYGNAAVAEQLAQEGGYAYADHVMEHLEDLAAANSDQDLLARRINDAVYQGGADTLGNAAADAARVVARVQQEWNVVTFFKAEEVLDKVITSGAFLSRWATGTTNGDTDVTKRSNAEKKFGYRDVERNDVDVNGAMEDALGKERPVYAALFVGEVAKGYSIGYGESRAYLDRSAAGKVSITPGDSLDAGGMGSNVVGTLTSPTPTLVGMDDQILRDLVRGGTGTMPGAKYIEAQVHGGMQLEDIGRLMVPTGVMASVREKLEAQALAEPEWAMEPDGPLNDFEALGKRTEELDLIEQRGHGGRFNRLQHPNDYADAAYEDLLGWNPAVEDGPRAAAVQRDPIEFDDLELDFGPKPKRRRGFGFNPLSRFGKKKTGDT